MASYTRAITTTMESDDGDYSTFIASTAEIARDGDIIEGGWVLDEFRANPVFLWAHGQLGLPLGRIPDIWEDEQHRLWIRVRWSSVTQMAREVRAQVSEGTLSAVSVSWRPGAMVPLRSLPMDDPRRRESGYLHRAPVLLEVSMVPVPADPRAVVTQRAEGSEAPADPLAELTARIAALEEQVDTMRTAIALREAEANAEPEGEDVPPEAPSEEDPIPRAWREAGWAGEVEREAADLAAWRAAGWPV